MWQRSAVVRLSIGLVCLTMSIFFAVDMLGIAPLPRDPVAEERIRSVEALAIRTVSHADRDGVAGMRTELDRAVRTTPDLLSAGLRDRHGRLLTATRRHRQAWTPDADQASLTHVSVPLRREGAPWATLEVRFAETGPDSLIASLWQRPMVRMMVVFATMSFFAYSLYLRRTLKHLDPSAVIPPRVQAALDLMSEGVLLLDRGDHIVLANDAFCERVGRSRESLVGQRASALGWRVPGSNERAREFPWQNALRDSSTTNGLALCFEVEGDTRTFMVNGAPVLDGQKVRGAIATFDDITKLEAKSRELEEALALLEKSRDEIRLQNDELRVLARCDPMTGAANRRSFLETSEAVLSVAAQSNEPLSCVMIDIDHFKRVNDDHGHATGDEVIRRVSRVLIDQTSDDEAVCRYGGEEFCVLLRNHGLEEATAMAERWRRTIAAEGFTVVPVTASFGVTSLRQGADDVYRLIDQADQALYFSKESGRNRVTRYCDLEEDAATAEA